MNQTLKCYRVCQSVTHFVVLFIPSFNVLRGLFYTFHPILWQFLLFVAELSRAQRSTMGKEMW